MAAVIFWLSAVVEALAWFAIPIAVVNQALHAAPDGDASSKARVLAENISDGMNMTAPLLLATPAAIAIWAIAVWRARRATRRGETDSP